MRYFDLHCDTAGVCFKNKILPDDPSLSVSTAYTSFFEEWTQCYAVYIDEKCSYPKKLYSDTITDFKAKISRFKKPNAILTLENALPVDSVEFVQILKNDGIRAVTLTWNGENRIAGGAYSSAGLTAFGRKVIKSLNANHIAVDLSHLNRKSFFEAGECAEIIFASHSCCAKTHNHPRNLADNQLKYIAERGGVIGVCFYPEFLGTKYPFEGVWRHLNHLLNIGLEKNIAIGSDFDGADMAGQLQGVRDIPKLYRYLFERGINKCILDDLFYNNADSFFEKF
ncbi:MAG: membrane dipeptidase [Clostridia bacterium]|nr:membrane dipeptidase [Clostridia bacterium]